MLEQYFKITNNEVDDKGFQYVDGLNIYKDESGIYFSKADKIHNYYQHGCYLRIVQLPITNPDFMMYEDNDGLFWANMVELKERYSLADLNTYHKFNLKMIDLTTAASNGFFDIVKYLVENGANVDESKYGPLKWSVSNGHLDVVKYLVEQGAFICDTAMYYAITGCHFDIIEYLLSKGATYSNCISAAIELVNKNRLDVILYLINNRFDIAQNYKYILIAASTKGVYDIVKYFVNNRNKMSIEYNVTPSDIQFALNASLVVAAKHGQLEVVKYLIAAGADIHTAFDTSLIFGAENGYMNIVKCLVEAGANIYAQNNKAIVKSAENNNLDITKYLLKMN